MSAPFAVHRRFVPLDDGTQLHCRIVGSGPPVLLLHPSPQSGALNSPPPSRTSFS